MPCHDFEHSEKHSNVAEMKNFLKGVWAKMTVQQCKKLILEMLDAKEGGTSSY